MGSRTGIPTFNVTSYGVHAHIPVIELEGLSIAVLFAATDEDELGLLLGKCDTAADPTRPLYHPCVFDGHLRPRLVSLTSVLHQVRNRASDVQSVGATWSWRDVYLTHLPLSRPTRHVLSNRGINTPFRIPQKLLAELRKARFKVTLPTSLAFPWGGDPPLTFSLHNRHLLGHHDIEVHLGLCTNA